MAFVAEAAGKLLQGVDKQVYCLDTLEEAENEKKDMEEEQDTDMVVWLLGRRHKEVEV